MVQNVSVTKPKIAVHLVFIIHQGEFRVAHKTFHCENNFFNAIIWKFFITLLNE